MNPMDTDDVKFKAYIRHLKILADVILIDFKHKEIEVDLSSGYGDNYVYNFNEVDLFQYNGVSNDKGVLIFKAF